MSRVAPPSGEVVPLERRKARTSQVAQMLFDRQGGVCGICRTFLGVSPFEIDHMAALALGGSNGLGNLWAICVPCHRSKTKRDMKAIAKVKRLIRQANPETRKIPKRKIRSRGFPKRG